MRFFPRTLSALLTADLWELDLECQSANEVAWATGRHPMFSRAAGYAARLDSELDSAARRLYRRAGDLRGTPLAELIEMPESDAVSAAAALRVLDGDAHLRDSESLQPGIELPAVGYWAARLS